MVEKRNAYQILILEHEGKEPFRRRGRRGKGIMDITKIECGSVDWIHVVQDLDQWRILSTC
jgi:hypothetical protein